MTRWMFFFVSLATVATGATIIATEHKQDAVCNAYNSHGATLGMNSNCLGVVGLYFTGFALVVVGLLFLVATIVVIKKRSRGEERRRSSARRGTLRKSRQNH